ncbi:hypothetical protein A7U60_g3324 [Sanghuangporus baumii]|uniref:Metallo-beta-lactamase domain-containing protein n=1 Tax=Sanghuangporus baumii TaxID=108892 RepID=A0A9Q5I0S3_SANBA|nr:hypothetical protein A7U60_g3324 [Sanghuangporus baumii]
MPVLLRITELSEYYAVVGTNIPYGSSLRPRNSVGYQNSKLNLLSTFMLLLLRARPSRLQSKLSSSLFIRSSSTIVFEHTCRSVFRENKLNNSRRDGESESIDLSPVKMSHTMAVTFLGTSSGGGPSDSRSCSSLALDIVVVDCAEGTTRQFMLQPERYGPRRLKSSRITKIFITHLHFDHCMGIITLLANRLRGAAGASQPPRSKPPVVELYGPAGLRTFVRNILKMTMTDLTERYCVHELLTPSDTLTSCDEFDMHPGESVGRNIISVSTGLWFDLAVEGSIQIDAAPITHRGIRALVPGFATSFEKWIISSGKLSYSNASLLVHEATDAYIPVEVDRNLRGDKKTPESIQAKTVAKGHSTPAIAGAFAKTINAERLVLNHFSAKFPAPIPHRRDRRRLVMGEIERQASAAWGLGRALAATDFMRIDIPGAPVESRFKEPSMDSDSLESTQYQQHELPHVFHRPGPARNVLKRRKT